MTIEDRWPCAFCTNRRTVRWGGNTQYCFNCRRRWHSSSRGQDRGPSDLERTVLFSNAELIRLGVYRDAVRAGFYTDYLTW